MDAYDTAKWLRWQNLEAHKALVGFHNILDALVEYDGPDLHAYLAEQVTVVNNVTFVEGVANEIFSAGYAELCRIDGKLVVPDFCGTQGSSLHEVVTWGVFQLPASLSEMARANPPDGFFETDDEPTQWLLALKMHWEAFSEEWKGVEEKDGELSEWYARLTMELVQAIRLADSYPLWSADKQQQPGKEDEPEAGGVEELSHTRRFRPPMCMACGKVRMRVTTSGAKGSRTRHLKCPKCEATAKVSRTARTT